MAAEFDRYADAYDGTLDRALSVTGDDSAHFARARVTWLRRRLARRKLRPRIVLDYGCGVGASTPHFFEVLGAERVIGVDVSERSLATATRTWGSDRAVFRSIADPITEEVDLAFTNGVFHHIPLADREDAVRFVQRTLRPGGVFAFWENNPWNPGTQLVMARCEFDKDAIKITPPSARRLLKSGGFHVLETTFCFIFPSALAALRPLEPLVATLPIGGQYLVLACK